MATAGTRSPDRVCSGTKNQAAAKVSPLLNITSRFSNGIVRPSVVWGSTRRTNGATCAAVDQTHESKELRARAVCRSSATRGVVLRGWHIAGGLALRMWEFPGRILASGADRPLV